MQAETSIHADDQERRSFIERARRTQIVSCAIDTIATLGYAQASLAQIARRAGISKGVISYHFAGKEELIREVLASVFTAGAEFMVPKLRAETSAAGALRAYIESNLAFMHANRNSLLAVVEIVSHFRVGDAGPRLVVTMLESAVTDLERILRWGQETGEFREFSTRVMATAIRNAIDGVPPQLVADATLDVEAYAQELATLFQLATRKERLEKG
ncbi:MAG TPA: TetR/AcrR family transcriptional regulator [Chthonomonadaceae bacterium]|nr:TetR/AcrR family transcriptional regulator [Chthonomonadaceae bacterium]